MITLRRIGQGVAGAGVLEADAGHDVARVDVLLLDLVVGVHLEQPTDALLVEPDRVFITVPPLSSWPEYTRK